MFGLFASDVIGASNRQRARTRRKTTPPGKSSTRLCERTGYEFEGSAPLSVVLSEIFQEWSRLLCLLPLHSGTWIDEFRLIRLRKVGECRASLGLAGGCGSGVGGSRRWCVCVDDDVASAGVAEDVPRNVKILPDDQGFDGAKLQPAEGIFDTVADPASVHGDLIEVLLQKLLLLYELDVAE